MKLFKKITMLLSCLMVSAKVFSATFLYPPSYHQGWGNSLSAEWWWIPVNVPDSIEMYRLDTVPWGCSSTEVPFSTIPTIGKIYVVDFFFGGGYIPSDVTQQPSGAFRIEMWDSTIGLLGITLPCPPWIDDLNYIFMHGMPEFHERVYGTRYKFAFLPNPQGNNHPPIIYAALVKNIWGDPKTGGLGYWEIKDGLGSPCL